MIISMVPSEQLLAQFSMSCCRPGLVEHETRCRRKVKKVLCWNLSLSSQKELVAIGRYMIGSEEKYVASSVYDTAVWEWGGFVTAIL